MTSNGLRAQYLIPNLSLSAIAYPSIRPFHSGHVITQSRKISANSLPAERKQIVDRGLLCRIFLKKPSFFRTDFFTELDPQTRLLPVPKFGVNTYPEQDHSSRTRFWRLYSHQYRARGASDGDAKESSKQRKKREVS
jgi:hypothetical protein